ncbi:hypothetical protein EVAR_16720_1 [Eumeta japonica]|uniref:Uncharacterized protein n=1 Tax=Eumeta variegata TaxID=151549 RepID=A0A4C1V5Y6_EUMVA|nr:hypothetical protein EVAR_16720_1 [Eumeta japonica]
MEKQKEENSAEYTCFTPPYTLTAFVETVRCRRSGQSHNKNTARNIVRIKSVSEPESRRGVGRPPAFCRKLRLLLRHRELISRRLWLEISI